MTTKKATVRVDGRKKVLTIKRVPCQWGFTYEITDSRERLVGHITDIEGFSQRSGLVRRTSAHVAYQFDVYNVRGGPRQAFALIVGYLNGVRPYRRNKEVVTIQ